MSPLKHSKKGTFWELFAGAFFVWADVFKKSARLKKIVKDRKKQCFQSAKKTKKNRADLASLKNQQKRFYQPCPSSSCILLLCLRGQSSECKFGGSEDRPRKRASAWARREPGRSPAQRIWSSLVNESLWSPRSPAAARLRVSSA